MAQSDAEMNEAPVTSPAPWYEAFPAVKTEVDPLTSRQLLQRLWMGNLDFVLIDLRRNDCEGGIIQGAINLPAQTIYHTIPALHRLFSDAKVKTVIFYCGSSQGRAPRCAGWFADYLKEKKDESMKSVILAGGIKEWATQGDDFTKYMYGYDESVWHSI